MKSESLSSSSRSQVYNKSFNKKPEVNSHKNISRHEQVSDQNLARTDIPKTSNKVPFLDLVGRDLTKHANSSKKGRYDKNRIQSAYAERQPPIPRLNIDSASTPS